MDRSGHLHSIHHVVRIQKGVQKKSNPILLLAAHAMTLYEAAAAADEPAIGDLDVLEDDKRASEPVDPDPVDPTVGAN
jgi:hypothetical protein